MRHSRGSGWVTVGLMGALALLGCDGATEGVLGPMTPAALAAAATQVSPSELIASLGLEASQLEEVHGRVESLHTSMLALHEAIPEDVESLNPEARAELHQALEGQMKEVHERHKALMGSLTEEQQQRFAEHVHARMEGSEDHAPRVHEGGLLGKMHAGTGHDRP